MATTAQTRDVALEHYADRQRFVNATSEVVTAMWAEVKPDNIAGSWASMLPEATAVVSGAQLGAARAADGYVDEALDVQDIDSTAAAPVDPAGFSGTASDGRGLMSLLANPVVVTLLSIQDGIDVARALGYGRTNLDMLARTQVADAGRLADQVALTARPKATGYVRVAVGKSCARCLMLAGRTYEWSAGFKRHPMCDCIHLPRGVTSAAGLVQHPRAIYNDMTRAERLRAGFTIADQRALADGADIDQIINARHRPGALRTAGGQRITTEATTRRGLAGMRLGAGAGRRANRLTVDEIYRVTGGDRDAALRLLQRNGYLFNVPGRSIGGAVSIRRTLDDLPASPIAAATDPALSMKLAELKAIVRAHAGQVGVPLSFFGTKKADIVRGLRSWESTYRVKIAGLPEWKPPPVPRPGFENVPPLNPPDPKRPPLKGAALNQWSDHFVHDLNSGRPEFVNAKGDTPPEGVRVENLRISHPMLSGPFAHSGYIAKSGTAWRFDGVAYLIEHSPADAGAPWVSRALMELRAAHATIPAAQRVNRSYAIALGDSPDDAYWQAKFNNPDHRGAMSAGSGHTNIWHFAPATSRVDVDSLRHETGHSLDDSIGRQAQGSQSPQWESAARRDQSIVTSIQSLSSTTYQATGLGDAFDPGRAWPWGVTKYGKSSPAEDFAESVMLYQMGPIATGRLPGMPPMTTLPSGATIVTDANVLYFRDLYPARAAILDGIFPDIARAQKAEIAALRAPKPKPAKAAKPTAAELSKMTVVQLRAAAKAQGLKGYSSMRKADLVAALGGKTAPARSRAAAKVPMPEFKGIPAADLARARRIVESRYRGLDFVGDVGREDGEWLRAFEERHGGGVIARLTMNMRIDLDYEDWRKWNGGKTKADLEREMKTLLSDAPIVIRRGRESTLVDILRRGRMRTQFETKRSGGLYNPKTRAEFEQSMWGYAKDLDPTKRPVYGYFVPGGVDNEFAAGWASGYGSIRIVLKEETRRRTSFTVGDSLGRNAIASSPDKPDWRSYGFSHDREGRPRNYSSSGFYGDVGYIEAQVHGGVTVDDIAEVVFAEQPKPATVNALRRAGIPWRIGKLRPARFGT